MRPLALTLSLLTLSGCTLPANNQPTPFLENTMFEHVIGGLNPEKKQVTFVYSRAGERDRTVVVNVDVEPIEIRFKLCENNGVYVGLSQVDLANISRTKVNCDSWLAITPLVNGKYALSYELNLLLGFRTMSVEGKHVYVPLKKKLAQYKAVYTPNSIAHPLKRYANDTIIESTTVEFNW
ncbi:Lipoprotein [Vibrio neptunius]